MDPGSPHSKALSLFSSNLEPGLPATLQALTSTGCPRRESRSRGPCGLGAGGSRVLSLAGAGCGARGDLPQLHGARRLGAVPPGQLQAPLRRVRPGRRRRRRGHERELSLNPPPPNACLCSCTCAASRTLSTGHSGHRSCWLRAGGVPGPCPACPACAGTLSSEGRPRPLPPKPSHSLSRLVSADTGLPWRARQGKPARTQQRHLLQGPRATWEPAHTGGGRGADAHTQGPPS